MVAKLQSIQFIDGEGSSLLNFGRKNPVGMALLGQAFVHLVGINIDLLNKVFASDGVVDSVCLLDINRFDGTPYYEFILCNGAKQPDGSVKADERYQYRVIASIGTLDPTDQNLMGNRRVIERLCDLNDIRFLSIQPITYPPKDSDGHLVVGDCVVVPKQPVQLIFGSQAFRQGKGKMLSNVEANLVRKKLFERFSQERASLGLDDCLDSFVIINAVANPYSTKSTYFINLVKILPDGTVSGHEPIKMTCDFNVRAVAKQAVIRTFHVDDKLAEDLLDYIFVSGSERLSDAKRENINSFMCRYTKEKYKSLIKVNEARKRLFISGVYVTSEPRSLFDWSKSCDRKETLSIEEEWQLWGAVHNGAAQTFYAEFTRTFEALTDANVGARLGAEFERVEVVTPPPNTTTSSHAAINGLQSRQPASETDSRAAPNDVGAAAAYADEVGPTESTVVSPPYQDASLTSQTGPRP